MGWSCGVEAGRTMDALSAACVQETGSQNVYRDGDASYFWEVSRTEHGDGAITGSVFRTYHAADGTDRCHRCGTFRIEGDGIMTRGPKKLRTWALAARVKRNASWTPET